MPETGAHPVAATAPSAPAGIRAASYLPELEALRGVAIALVYCFHVDGLVTFFQQRPAPTLLTGLIRGGNTGVDLFFVLSAFLLAVPFVVEADGGASVSVRRYFLRRGLRILPLYWTAITPVVVLTAATWRELVEGLPLYVMLRAITPPMPRMFPYATVWWSLATEFQFYLLLPSLRYVLRSRAWGFVAGAALVAWGIVYAIALRTPALQTDGWVWLFTSLFGRVPVFVFGVACAVVYVRRGARARAQLHASGILRNGGADAILAALVLLLLVLLRARAAHSYLSERAPLVVWHVAGGALWAGVVALVLVAPLRCRRLLCNRALTWLGTVSYSVYLWHVPVVFHGLLLGSRLVPGSTAGWNTRSAFVVAGITAAVAGWSALSYRVVEQPFLRYKTRFG